MKYPELHFNTGLFYNLTKELPGDKHIGALVTPGALLVTLSDFVPADSPLLDLEPGLNTLVTDDNKIISSCYGYPHSEIVVESKEKSILRVSVLPLINKDESNMEAALWLLPFPGKNSQVDKNTVEAALVHQKVNFGVDRKAIESCLHQLAETGEPVINHLIARGRPPLHGKDAFLRFHIEIGPIPGKELADGSIDFRERRMFVGVEKGQIIATKVAFTIGSSGIDIEGNEISANPGKDLVVKVSDDASYNEEDQTIRATESGILSVVNNDSIRVMSKHLIQGDINYETGNIRSQNAVEITGTVLPKFVVSVSGDLLVGGNIQRAGVNSRGNIVVKGGVVGPNSSVNASGDGDFNYIERAYVSVGGNAVIRSAVYYSNLRVSGNLFGTEKTRLVGGTIIVGGSIKAGQIGAGSAKPILIGAGIVPKRFKRYKGLQLRHDGIVEKIQNMANRYGKVDQRDKKFNYYVKELEEIEKELQILNLMGHDAETVLRETGRYRCNATIEVSGLLAAGTTIRICNSIRVVEKDMDNVCARVNPTSGEIELHMIF